MKKKISILGSTGSIGTSTLDVVRQNTERFEVVSLACGKNLSVVKEQIQEFKPQLVSVSHPQDAVELREGLGKEGPQIVVGIEGACQVATHPEVEVVVSAIVGAAGLLPTLRAIEAKKIIALANKETMVIAGELMRKAAARAEISILPVDSEHSALFQCLQGHNSHEVKKLILTASGGPFRETSLENLEKVTVAQALKHPNWNMGAKITIDSATLMNKGLEVIEARWLFDVAPEKIEVLVHPQSVIHSMIEYIDGSVLAQLGIPDMRIPIAYALSFPERLPNELPVLNLAKLRQLSFFEPDTQRFPSLSLAKKCLEWGGAAPCVLNAANEVVVQCFLEEKIAFLDIPRIVSEVLIERPDNSVENIEELLKMDQWARQKASEKVREHSQRKAS